MHCRYPFSRFLILDEPTNDLDILTLQVLEDFLMDFKGCLVIVSHDRYFLDKLTDHLFVFEGNGKVRDFLGNYNEYRLQLKEEARQQKSDERAASSENKSITIDAAPKRKLSYKEQEEFKKLEIDIEKLSKEKNDLADKLSSGSLEHQQIQTISSMLEKIIGSLDEKELRWLELSEFA